MIIDEDPVEITVHRVQYMDDGAGGRVAQESDLPPFTGRLVPSRQGEQRATQNEAGEIQLARWTLIAPWDADLQAGSNVQDSFSVNGRRFRVRRVIVRKWRGETYAVHAALEEGS